MLDANVFFHKRMFSSCTYWDVFFFTHNRGNLKFLALDILGELEKDDNIFKEFYMFGLFEYL